MRRNKLEQIMDALQLLSDPFTFQPKGFILYRLSAQLGINHAVFKELADTLAKRGFVEIAQGRPKRIRITSRGRQLLDFYRNLSTELGIEKKVTT